MMTMAAVWLASIAGETVEPQHIESLIRNHCTPDDQVEHLRVRAGPEGILVFGFLMADTPEQARATLHRLTHQTLTNEPELHLWRMV